MKNKTTVKANIYRDLYFFHKNVKPEDPYIPFSFLENQIDFDYALVEFQFPLNLDSKNNVTIELHARNIGESTISIVARLNGRCVYSEDITFTGYLDENENLIQDVLERKEENIKLLKS